MTSQNPGSSRSTCFSTRHGRPDVGLPQHVTHVPKSGRSLFKDTFHTGWTGTWEACQDALCLSSSMGKPLPPAQGPVHLPHPQSGIGPFSSILVTGPESTPIKQSRRFVWPACPGNTHATWAVSGLRVAHSCPVADNQGVMFPRTANFLSAMSHSEKQSQPSWWANHWCGQC